MTNKKSTSQAIAVSKYPTSSFRKERKKRLLFDIFYLRWELELLSACIAIAVLLVLPGWLNDKVNQFLAGHGTSMGTGWITVACNVLLAGFTIYVLLRFFWLYYIQKGEEPTQGKLHFAKATDHIAELIFSLCLIILMAVLLVSMIEFFAILLKNWLPENLKITPG